MIDSVTLLILLLAAGVVLIGAEIFVPGAILGALGGLCLAGAVMVAFSISAATGFYVAVGVVILVGLTVVLWIKLFPRSSIGRKMTLDSDGRTFKTSDPKLALIDKEGTASSDLRPAGFALVDGQRIDVVTEGGMIARGQKIVVVKVEGNRIVVRKANG